jgi:ribosomal protein S1
LTAWVFKRRAGKPTSMWEESKRRFPVGRRVRGVVTEHCPFGVFVDLGDPVARGLVQITDFLDEGRMTADLYLPVGSAIEAVVIGHTDDRRKQVWLSVQPSRLVRPD